MQRLRILLADDHEVLRKGVKALLESHPAWEVVGEAATGREAVEKSGKARPDVVVLDITMPELNGLEAGRKIREVSPGTELLFFTMHSSEQMVREAIEIGARGYILKSDAGSDLVGAVEAARRHKTYFSAKVSETVFQSDADPNNRWHSTEAASNPLTAREREILQLLAEGKNSKEVAANLGIKVKTAETHRSNIMRKLNIHSLSGLVRYAIRNKIIQP